MSGLIRNNESFVSKAFFYFITFLTILLFVCTISACSSDDDGGGGGGSKHAKNSVERDVDGDGTIDQVFYFTYDGNDNLTKTEEDWGFNDIIDRVGTFTYDDDGNMLSETWEDLTAVPDIPRPSNKTFTYNADGNREYEYVDENWDGTNDLVGTYIYKPFEKVGEIRWEDTIGGTLIHIDTFTYNPEGSYAREDVDSGNDGTINSVKYYTYDFLGNLSTIESDEDNDDTIDVAEYYEYAGALSEMSEYRRDDEYNGTIDLIRNYYPTFEGGTKTTEIKEIVNPGQNMDIDNVYNFIYEAKGEGKFINYYIDEDGNGIDDTGYFAVYDENEIISEYEIRPGPLFTVSTGSMYLYYDTPDHPDVIKRREWDYQNDGILDRILLNEIDVNGKILHELIDNDYAGLVYIPGDFSPDEGYLYEYDANGNVTKKDFEHILRTYWYINFYEDAENPTRLTRYEIWQGVIGPDIFIEAVDLYYDDAGHLISEEVYPDAFPHNVPKIRETSYVYLYDYFIDMKEYNYGNNLVTDRVDYFDYSEYGDFGWKLDFEKQDMANDYSLFGDTVIQYLYDSEKGTLEIEYWDDDYDAVTLDPADPVSFDPDRAYYYITYDNLKYFSKKFDDGLDTTIEDLTYYHYNSYEVIEENDKYYDPGNPEDIDSIVYYTYDIDWKCTEKKWDDDGNGTIDRSVILAYDIEGRLVLEIIDKNNDGHEDAFNFYYY